MALLSDFLPPCLVDLIRFLFFRFLQGPETDQATVQKIRDAIKEQKEITVQLINYTKSGNQIHFVRFRNEMHFVY